MIDSLNGAHPLPPAAALQPTTALRPPARRTGRLALTAAALAFVMLVLVVVPFVQFDLIEQSQRLSQAHAMLWLAFFSPVMVFPAMGHLLDVLVPLASADPRIALIPHFGLMFVLWAALFFVLALALRRLLRAR